VSTGNLFSTTITNLPTQSRQNNSSYNELKVSNFNMLKNNELRKSIYDKDIMLGVTTLLCQTNHKLEQVNLFIQATRVEGLQIKSIHAFSQRSIDWQIFIFMELELSKPQD